MSVTSQLDIMGSYHGDYIQVLSTNIAPEMWGQRLSVSIDFGVCSNDTSATVSAEFENLKIPTENT